MGKLNLKNLQVFGDAKILKAPEEEQGGLRDSQTREMNFRLNTSPRTIDNGSMGDHGDEKLSVNLNQAHSGRRRNAMPVLKPDYEHADMVFKNTKALLQAVPKEQPAPVKATPAAAHGSKNRRAALATLPPTDSDAEALFQQTRALLQKVPGRRRASIPPRFTPRHPAIGLRRGSWPAPNLPSHITFNYPFLKPTPKKNHGTAPLLPLPPLRPVKRVPRNPDNFEMEKVNLKPVQRDLKSVDRETETVDLKPVERESRPLENYEMEQVGLEPVKRELRPAEDEEPEEVHLKPIPQEPPAPASAPAPVVKPALVEKPEPEPVVQEVAKSVPQAKDAPTIKVGTSDVFVAFTMPECHEEPSQQDYKKLAKTTQKYFADHLKKKYDTFQSVSVGLHKTYFDQQKPSPTYNVYIEWDIQAEFENSPKAPDRHKLCRSLVKANLMRYLTKHVATCYKTPFREATGVFIHQVNSEPEE